MYHNHICLKYFEHRVIILNIRFLIKNKYNFNNYKNGKLSIYKISIFYILFLYKNSQFFSF